MSEQATLSSANKRKIEEMLTKARNSGDGEDEALIHTGIPAVELAIDEYLKKYAYTAKVKTAVDTFKKKVEEKDMHAKMLKAIHNDEQARCNINAQLKVVSQQLADGKSAAQFSRKIEKLDMTHEAEKQIKKLRAKVSAALMREDTKDVLTTLEVQQILMRLDKKVRDIQSDVKTELENIIEDVIVENAKLIMEEYKEQVHLLITSGDLETQEFEAGKGICFLEKEVPNAQEIIDKYKYNEQYDTGQKEWVKNTAKKWYKPWTWFQESGWYLTVYADREMVKYSDVYDDFVQPVIKNFNENLERAKKTAQEEAERFKGFFINELNVLNTALERKVKETEVLTRDQDIINRKLEEEKIKVKWLETFMQRLDRILEI